MSDEKYDDYFNKMELDMNIVYDEDYKEMLND
jgi:hypothetical protein